MTYKKQYEEALKSLKQTENELRKHWINAQKAVTELDINLLEQTFKPIKKNQKLLDKKLLACRRLKIKLDGLERSNNE